MPWPPREELGEYAGTFRLARLLIQGAVARRRLGRLPDAAGPDQGSVGDGREALRLLVFGESTAAGVGVGTHAEGLGPVAASTLSRLLDRPVQWRVQGHSGFTARRLLDEALQHLPVMQVDAVLLATGANDAVGLTRRSTWQQDLTTLIHALRARLGAVPIVLGRAPPFEYSPTLPEPLRSFLGFRCRRINEATEEVLSRMPLIRLAPGPLRANGDEFASDGFHPGARGYRGWGELLAQSLAPLCQQPDRLRK